MGNLCIIPARGGSKRIPRKNIKHFHGKPIIAYSIETALRSNLFEEVMVSTDDTEISQVAKEFGASVPFYRSDKNSDDFATTSDVIKEVILNYEQLGRTFENVCCCYPTAPFISVERLNEGYTKLGDPSIDSVLPVVEFSYPILRSLKMNSDNIISMNWPEYINTRSQDLPKAFHDAGQWYWFKLENFLKTNQIIGDRSYGLTIESTEVQDIDNVVDWKIAEMKYQVLNK